MADKDPNELSPEEAQALARERSVASRKDFDPAEADASEKVVELPNRKSVQVKDLVDHDDPVIAADAKAVVDGNYPGGPNWPNGPAKKTAAKKSEAKPSDS